MKRFVLWSVIVSLLMPGVAWAQLSPEMLDANAKNEAFWRQFCEQNKHVIGNSEQCAPYVPHYEPVSRSLAWLGIGTALVGTALTGPWGTQYDIVGDKYCVTTYSVSEGGCMGSGRPLAIGLGLIGGGALMVWAGLRSKTVKVNGSVTPSSKSVGATVAWGGSHGR